MLTKRASVGSPISGLRPEKLMWSAISISSPGGMSGRNEPAALVRISRSAPSAFSASSGARITAGVAALVVVRPPAEHRHARALEPPDHQPRVVPRHPGVREVRQLGIVDRHAVDRVGQVAEARAEHQPERDRLGAGAGADDLDGSRITAP